MLPSDLDAWPAVTSLSPPSITDPNPKFFMQGENVKPQIASTAKSQV